VVLLGLLVVTLFAAFVLATRRPTEKPVISIALLGYTNWHEFTWAKVRVTNIGSGSVSYYRAGTAPGGWLKTESASGWTDASLGVFTGALMVLEPGSNDDFSAVFPTNVFRWQFGFSIRTAGVRERAIWRVLESRISRKVPELLFYPIRLLPDRTGPGLELKSEMFEVSNAASSPHDKSLHTTR